MNKYKTVDAYIKAFPKSVATRLSTIRGIIKKAAPKAEEGISYGMAAYRLNGILVYFAGFKNHIGLYALPSAIRKFKKEIEKYKTAKATIQFQHTERLPVPLIKKIIAFRVAEARNK